MLVLLQLDPSEGIYYDVAQLLFLFSAYLSTSPAAVSFRILSLKTAL